MHNLAGYPKHIFVQSNLSILSWGFEYIFQRFKVVKSNKCCLVSGVVETICYTIFDNSLKTLISSWSVTQIHSTENSYSKIIIPLLNCKYNSSFSTWIFMPSLYVTKMECQQHNWSKDRSYILIYLYEHILTKSHHKIHHFQNYSHKHVDTCWCTISISICKIRPALHSNMRCAW